MWVRRVTANRSARSDGISASPGSDLVSGAGESGVGEKGSRPTGVHWEALFAGSDEIVEKIQGV